ncbi:ATP-binding cassette domain-containing protein [Chitinophaga solisilvae]|uniref:ATP-binding cassette domain-containing protein n=1 Tax=Chitinophaga solisilvae TaxID=1233460 RepID=UPI00136BF314|nr:ATP-binding cassette domain-containing protein [Chitinophaga solisilvae]
MKSFFLLLSGRSKGFFLFILLVGLMNSILNTTFMVIVGRFIFDANFYVFKGFDHIGFVVLLLTSLLLNFLFNFYIIRLGAGIIHTVELNLVQRVKRASFMQFTTMNNSEFYAALSNLRILGEAPSVFFNLFNSVLTVLCCVGYLYWMSLMYGIIMTLLIGILIVSYMLRDRISMLKFERLRKLQVEYYKYIHDLLIGFKDLKMSHVKNSRIYDEHIRMNKELQHTTEVGLKKNFAASSVISTYTWYLLLGIVLFMIPRTASGAGQISSFVVILLYIIAPLTSITAFFEFYSSLRNALKVLDAINAKFPETAAIPEEQPSVALSGPVAQIRFDNVCFDYIDSEHGRTFSLGPVNLELQQGEVVFVIGGNGSGKSTFLNLLTGLVKPSRGVIHFNGHPVLDELYDEYRNKLAVVFYDGYLFHFNYEQFTLNADNEKLARYLRLVQLDGIVNPDYLLEDRDRLSKGQQKRLALVLALMMERKVLILDEWAAEQDPGFKQYFYQEIIPLLKEEGVTVIAITHDDEYFSCASRILKFTDGRFISTNSIKEAALLVSRLPEN